MKYNWDNTYEMPIPIRHVIVNGQAIKNPTDEQLDKLNIGHYLVNEPQPEYDPKKHNLTKFYKFDGSTISGIWKLLPIVEVERETLCHL